MKTRYLTYYFFAFTAALYLYAEWPIEIVGPGYKNVVISENITFEQTVQEWSVELSKSIPTPAEVEGNCLPVAMELQKRIVNTGRIAFIAVVDKDVLPTRHAMVVYSSEVGGRLDSVIDNGAATFNKVVPKDFLDEDVFGTYLGTCEDPDPTQGLCAHLGAAW